MPQSGAIPDYIPSMLGLSWYISVVARYLTALVPSVSLPSVFVPAALARSIQRQVFLKSSSAFRSPSRVFVGKVLNDVQVDQLK